MQATAAATGASRTSWSVRQTAPRSAPRIARKRKTADAGMPTIAATARERLRRLPGASDSVGPSVVSGTTVTPEGCGAACFRGPRQRSRSTLALRLDHGGRSEPMMRCTPGECANRGRVCGDRPRQTTANPPSRDRRCCDHSRMSSRPSESHELVRRERAASSAFCPPVARAGCSISEPQIQVTS